MTEINPVLVVVDVQNGFVTEHSAHVVPVIKQLVREWIDGDRDVVFTRYLNFDDSPFEKIMGWFRLKESPEVDIVEELRLLGNEATAVVDKTIYTLFSESGIALAKNREWTDMFICGIDTEVCVLKTAVDAFEMGIRPWILVDACASHSGRLTHDAGMIVAEKMIGRRQSISSSEIDSILNHTYYGRGTCPPTS